MSDCEIMNSDSQFRNSDSQFRKLDFKFERKILDRQFQLLNSYLRLWIENLVENLKKHRFKNQILNLDFRFSISNVRFQIFNFECQILDFRLSISNFRLSISNFRLSISNVRFRILNIMFRLSNLLYHLNIKLVPPVFEKNLESLLTDVLQNFENVNKLWNLPSFFSFVEVF